MVEICRSPVLRCLPPGYQRAHPIVTFDKRLFNFTHPHVAAPATRPRCARGRLPFSSHASVARTATRTSSQGPASALRFNYYFASRFGRIFTRSCVLCLLRRRRLREGARSVGPGLGAQLHLGAAGDVAPLCGFMGENGVVSRSETRFVCVSCEAIPARSSSSPGGYGRFLTTFLRVLTAIKPAGGFDGARSITVFGATKGKTRNSCPVANATVPVRNGLAD